MSVIPTELLSVTQGSPTLVNPPGLYDSSGFGYSQMAVVETPARFIYLSGQGGENEQGEHAPDFESQVRQALLNLKTGLRAAGGDVQNIAKLTIYIVDHSMERLQIYARNLQEFLDGRPGPAATLIPVPRLALDAMLFEVEAVAVVPLQEA